MYPTHLHHSIGTEECFGCSIVIARKTIDLKWIYLESGHGKGIPDGIGATVKKAIKDVSVGKPHEITLLTSSGKGGNIYRSWGPN